MSRDVTRRDALKRGAATAGVAALAGCRILSDAVPFVGGGHYTNWVFEPGTVGDSDHLLVSYADYATVVETEPEFDGDYYERNVESKENTFPLDQANLGIEDFETSLRIEDLEGFFCGRVAADYRRDPIESELRDGGYEVATDHGVYTVYLDPVKGRAVGIDGTDIVYGAGGSGKDTTPVHIVETMIDTKNGNEDRYVEDEGFATLTDQFGSPTLAYGGTQDPPEETDAEMGQFEGCVASGYAATVDGATTDVRYVAVFESESVVDVGGVRDYATDAFDEMSDGSATQDGTAALVTGRADTDEFDEPLYRL